MPDAERANPRESTRQQTNPLSALRPRVAFRKLLVCGIEEPAKIARKDHRDDKDPDHVKEDGAHDQHQGN